MVATAGTIEQMHLAARALEAHEASFIDVGRAAWRQAIAVLEALGAGSIRP